MRFDALVVGAGPGGSSAACRLARANASVLLVDRARFPRDKPCGGGVTVRALRELPVAIDPVVEASVDRVEVTFRYRRRFERRSAVPLCLMTQRRRLDAHLVEGAARAGAEVRDGVRVSDVRIGDDGVEARIGDVRVQATALVVADGANGTTGQAVGLGGDLGYGVALEGNVAHEHAPERLRDRILIDVGVIPGGYAWIFPKGDHVNVGVGGWAAEAPRLRGHLARLCREYAIDPARVEEQRGYRLPYKTRSTVLARGRAVVVGDAAGLVDPLTGDGIYEAAVSARLAAEAVLELLAGRSAGPNGYAAAVERELGRLVRAAWAAKHALDRFPRVSFAVIGSRSFWPAVEELLSGKAHHFGDTNRRSRLPLAVLRTLGR